MEQRHFAIKALNNFGFQRSTMETIIMVEVDELIEELKSQNGRGISTHTIFNIAVLNSIWKIVSGERFSHHDQKLEEIMNSVNNSLKV